MAVIVITAISSWAAMLLLITGGHPLEFIKYNFVDVANDQWWYFSSYQPSKRIFEASQVTRIISEKNDFPLGVLAVVLLCVIKTRRIEFALLAWIGISLFAGGAVASLGGQLGKYFGGFYYWGAVTAILLAAKALQILASRTIQISPGIAHSIELCLLTITFGALFAGAAKQWMNYQQASEIAESDSGRFYVPEFGGFLATGWKDYINYARSHRDSKIIEEYWGILSSLNRSFPSWPVDAAIHALGEVRQTAQSKLANADLLVTTRFSTEESWQQWSLSQNFWFYEEVLSRWEPDYVSPTTIVWRKASKERAYSAVGCDVAKDGGGFTLASDANGFYAITVNYSASGAGRYLLMQKNNISAIGDGYVSLPINGSTASIPVLKTPESGSFFDIKVVGNSKVSASIKSCSAKQITYQNDETLHAPWSFYLTDDNWDHGVARRWAGFIVPNIELYVRDFVVGNYVKLENGDTRKVVDVKPAGKYLNVYVEGEILIPGRAGVPSNYVIVARQQANAKI